MAALIPVALILLALGYVAWPSVSQAFWPGPGGPGQAPTYFNPAPGDKITVLNARTGATDPNVGFSTTVQQEIARRLNDYGYLVAVFPGTVPASVNQPGMVGTLGQFMVLPGGNGSTPVAIPSDLGASAGKGEPGFFIVGLEQAPVNRGQGMGGTQPGAPVSPAVMRGMPV